MKKTKDIILQSQENEITEYNVYKRLSELTDEKNGSILREIAEDELRHYKFWKKITGKDVKPNKLKIFKFVTLARIFGITFAIKLMEHGEQEAQEVYDNLAESIEGAEQIVQDEDEHEEQLIQMIDEERLRYVSSIVLGLNDALVELTGALAGLTFAFQRTQLIALAGLITGVAAALSMGASEYLSTKSEEETAKHPVKASFYTGTAYLLTVVFLIAPFMILTNVYASLGWTIINAVIVIFVFTFYVSVAKDLPFKHRFGEMVGISLGIAALSFLIGVVIRVFLGLSI